MLGLEEKLAYMQSACSLKWAGFLTLVGGIVRKIGVPEPLEGASSLALRISTGAVRSSIAVERFLKKFAWPDVTTTFRSQCCPYCHC